MEHLTNCHGEWNMLFAAAGSVPIVGVWIKFKLQTLWRALRYAFSKLFNNQNG